MLRHERYVSLCLTLSPALYYLFAETWFAILFTVIVEIVPANTRGVCTAFFLFVMNIIAGELVT